ncbi:oligosaccharide flippase family protein [Lachnospiraceae bacterium WCA-9-b2]|jgi:Membrane protein involved in the export of O-antigen and teichoic acid|uniref:Oligosaccharide flippase family protein n=1 Tax=Sporofaciens musculi TaxID=2681861 RepID=A0A7X3MI24_9FIRM|nr:flippase [Sporofaciens musculi]MXP76823.1 oligosaccharide flippase family protein [Sporofaciens musculi]
MNNRVIKNASWIIMCRVVQAVLGLIISMIMARYLGPSNFGLLNYANSIVTFVIPVMRLGIHGVLVQEFVASEEYEGEILGTSITLSFISAIVCIIGIITFVSCVNAGERDTIIVCTLYSFTLIFQSFEMINYWFQAKLLAKYSSIIALIAYTVVSLYKIILLINRKSIFWFAVANTLDYLVIAAGLLIVYHRLGNQKLRYLKRRAKKLISIGKYYILSDLLITVFAQTDRIMLKSMMGNQATGYYSAAVACAGMTQFVFGAIIDSMRPTIFESRKKSEELYKKNLARLFSVIIYLSLIQSVVMTLFAPLIVSILYGRQFIQSISALQIVVWYTTFSYLGSARNIWILAEGKQKHLWKINLFGALANVLLNTLLIPPFGVNGAAIASLITQFATNFITGYIFAPIRGINQVILKGADPMLFVDTVKKIIRNR